MKGEVSGERPKTPSPPAESTPSLKRLAENSRKAAGEINKISQSPTPKIAISVQDLSRTIRSKKDPIIKEIKVAADTAKKPEKSTSETPETSTSETPETSTSAGSDLRRTIRSTDDPRINQIKAAADAAKNPKDVLAKKPEKSTSETSETSETSTSAGSTPPTTPESSPPPKSQTMSLKSRANSSKPRP